MDYLFFLLAYLIGSIPSSVWIGKRFYNLDVREHGSGNAGATNSFRILGKRVGSVVLIIDIFKAWFSTYVLSYMANDQSTENMLGLGMVAVLGHIFPIYIGFRGGKGIASLLGVIIAIQPTAALFSILTFLISLIFSRYVSLSSILAACTFPATIILYLKSDSNALIIFSVMVSVLVLFTHKKNIERLFKKEESRVKLPRRIFRRKLKRKRN
ncbi:glycerol-3-phosphate 1-O-acyltransferase PlsY [Flavobacteriales bacterium]|nr:glycerol-3-phosphate 1-O-acyltransferase PlsY [Flavobacteriales bacterium]